MYRNNKHYIENTIQKKWYKILIKKSQPLLAEMIKILLDITPILLRA
jgi:hypothetical protein